MEITTFAIGAPAWLGLLVFGATMRVYSTYTDFAVFAFFAALLAFPAASLSFMSGALLGNALQRVGLLGTPKELPQGEEEEDQEAEAWTPRKQAQWGIAGSIGAALISAVASVVAAALSQ